MYNKPEHLRAGDTIGVFLPSSPAREPFRSQGGIALRKMGFAVREVEEPLAGNDFLSRPPQRSLQELQEFFAAAAVRALWAGRGGYGSNYLLPLLDRLEIAEPKVVIASSDVSYLLWYLLERRRTVVFYGPMVYGGLASGACDYDQVATALTAAGEPLTYQGKVLCSGSARGRLTGGCLSNFASLLGTPYLPDVEGKILMLEDVNERPYRLDRLLWQCEQAGVFERCRALLLGEFPNCFKDAGEKETFYGRWREKFMQLEIPVLIDMPFGHAASARILPLGVEAEIDAATGLLSCESGVK